VRYESLHKVFQTRQIWIQIAFSIFVNWIIAPFLMVSFSPVKCDRVLSSLIMGNSWDWHGLSSLISLTCEKA
jgi:ACR3 family arsenite efflux pump ArsB